MLRADELAAIRGAVNAFLPDLCTISRGGSLLSPQPTMPDGSPLRCDVRPDKPVLIPGAGPLEHQEQWKIVLPDGTPVQAFDRINALGNIYSVVLDPNPNSRSSQTNVYAIQLYGPDPLTGLPTVPVYLRSNCVISIDRAAGGNDGSTPTTRASGVPARWQGPSSDMLQALGDSAMPALYVDPGVDLRQGDGVTLSSGVGYSPLPPFLAGRYPVRMVNPTLGAIPMTMAHLEAKVAQ